MKQAKCLYGARMALNAVVGVLLKPHQKGQMLYTDPLPLTAFAM